MQCVVGHNTFVSTHTISLQVFSVVYYLLLFLFLLSVFFLEMQKEDEDSLGSQPQLINFAYPYLRPQCNARPSAAPVCSVVENRSCVLPEMSCLLL